jgi:hypothetical protein
MLPDYIMKRSVLEVGQVFDLTNGHLGRQVEDLTYFEQGAISFYGDRQKLRAGRPRSQVETNSKTRP